MPLIGLLIIGVGVFMFRIGGYIEDLSVGGPFLSCFIMAALLFSVGVMCLGAG